MLCKGDSCFHVVDGRCTLANFNLGKYKHPLVCPIEDFIEEFERDLEWHKNAKALRDMEDD